jgi:hypothetical protein
LAVSEAYRVANRREQRALFGRRDRGSRSNPTKSSFSWLGQHWLAVVVIAGIAATCGWAFGRQQQGYVTAAGETTAPKHKTTTDPASHVAVSAENFNLHAPPTEARRDKQLQPPKATPSHVTAEQLVTKLATGTNSERHAALTTALRLEIELPPEILVHAYVNDPSDEVRLLAFTTYVDSISNDVDALRAALQDATNNSSSIVQAEAFRRLNELTSFEAAVASIPAQGAP